MIFLQQTLILFALASLGFAVHHFPGFITHGVYDGDRPAFPELPAPPAALNGIAPAL